MMDTWTIQGGSGFGYLTLEWTVSGSTMLDGYRGATANLQMDVRTYAPQSQPGDGPLFITQGGVYSIQRLPFFFDRPIDLVVSSNVVASSGYDEGGGPYAYFAAAQFGHTSTLTGITAYDASGRLIDGITITAASGAHYPVMSDAMPPGDPGGPTPSVPEPGSGALLAMEHRGGGLDAASRSAPARCSIAGATSSGPPGREDHRSVRDADRSPCQSSVPRKRLISARRWSRATVRKPGFDGVALRLQAGRVERCLQESIRTRVSSPAASPSRSSR